MKIKFVTQISIGLLLAASAGRTSAQLTAPARPPVVGARQPALSPDGTRLAFTYRGDVWVADTKGGRATPLTQHLETDAFPVFSPDGKWITFASKRTGNWDIFLVPSDGGATRQLTFHSGSEMPTGWSPDGKYLLFSSKRDTPNHAIYALDADTLQTRMLAEDYAPMNWPSYSPDGKTVVYGRYGFHWTRPRYFGSAAAQISLLNLTNGTRRALTEDRRQHLWTRFMPDGKHLLTVTVGETTPSVSKLDETISPVADNPRRTPNLWLYDLNGRGEPLTIFTGGAVRAPCVAAKNGDIAFEYGPDLWLLKSGKKEPEKIRLIAAADEKQTTRRREKITTGVTEAEPSPDGKSFAFGLRGEIWTIGIDKPKGVAGRSAEFARRLSDWAGDDSDFSWSQDGKKIYFTSDREFYTRLFEMDVESLKVKPLWNRTSDVDRVKMSPDGKQLGFWVTGREGGLYLLTLETGEARKLVSLPGPQWHGLGGGDFSWSPDMQWVAFSQRGESRAFNIWIIPTAGGEARNVTQLFAQHGLPAWSPDGKYLFFQSNRDGNGLYVLPLTKETARVSDVDLKFEKSTNVVKVVIDFDDLPRRIRKFSTQAPQADLIVTADGQILFLSEGDLWSVSYDGKETKRLTTGGGRSQLRASKDGKKISLVFSGEPHTMKLDDKKEEKVTFTADWERDVRAERQAAFTQFWRSYERSFYDANFHGRDWAKIRSRYEPLLDAVETPDEFATLLHMMVGELEASHSEVTAVGGPASPVTPQLGFTFDYGYAGPGLKVAGVPAGAPGSYPKTEIKPGEFVLAINGRDVRLDEKLYEWINDKQDRELEFLVSTNADKKSTRTVKYKALTPEEWIELNYRNRTDRLSKYVAQHGGGKLGYLHIASMNQNNQAQFEREIYEFMVGKEGMIIDVRFNNGGNISDTLIDWLERKQHGWNRTRDTARETAPYSAMNMKFVVLMNEHSYSNGEMFPHAMRARGLAKLVGMPTPGYVIWTFALKLVDGTNARMPITGVYRMDGTTMENNGEPPDVPVRLSPEDWLAERDPQLDKAISILTGKESPKP